MLIRRMGFWWIVAGSAGWLCGCQSVRPPGRAADACAQPLALSAAARNNAAALAAFGQAQLDEINKDPAAALAHYQQAARLEPDHEALQLKVALALLQQQRNQESLATLEALVRRHPRSEQALAWLALVYQSTGRGAEAAWTYQRLIRLAPQQASGYLKLAALYSRQGRDADALFWLQRGLARAAAQPELCKALADLYARRALAARLPDEAQRHRRRALELMEQACRAAPNDTALRSGWGALYIADGQFEKAYDVYKIIEDRFPGQLALRTKLAQSMAASGRHEPAIACFEKLVGQRPQDERLWFYLGELHDAAGHAAQAQNCFQHAADAATHAAPVSRLALW
ncbi:MAG: tetratricopeptide repeat protein [Kiritimatiellaeota bacterium]|nr:tetratricopeptide repeat protein [Kiritimatiellota bacterium]